MAKLTLGQAFEMALEHHRARRFSEAQSLCRQILVYQPAHVDALRMLGLLAHSQGRGAEALELLRRVVALEPSVAQHHVNLGVALAAQGCRDLALAAYRQAFKLQPDLAEAHFNRGTLLQEMGQLDEAIASYRTALERRPEYAEAQYNLAKAVEEQGKTEQSIAAYRRAVALRPTYVEAHIDLGDALEKTGRLDEAIATFQEALRLRPGSAVAHNNLANALQRAGRVEESIGAYQAAIAIDPDLSEAHYNLGAALHKRERLSEAVESYHRALKLRPDYTDAFNGLGNALRDSQKSEEAVAAYRQALALRPDFAEVHSNLGNALVDCGKVDEAAAAYRQAISLRGDVPEFHSNLGSVLLKKGRLDDAIAACRQAILLRPAYVEAHVNLANALQEANQLEPALAAYKQALALRTDLPETHNNMANVLRAMGRLDESIAAFKQALLLRPAYAEAHNNLGNAFKDAGRLDEALACYRRAEQFKGESWIAGNFLYAAHFHPDYDARRLWEEHARWNEKYARRLARSPGGHDNDRSMDRRLRIGYVSPDFRDHPVGRFLLPLLANHDHGGFEIVGYSDVRRRDAMTDVLRGYADLWQTTTGLSDEDLARQIREDRIDVLVDLTMHMNGSRLLVFARKPAPVQVTYLAYCGTTGLETIDYRLTDRYLDPPPLSQGSALEDDQYYSERSVRLPRTYWCYLPPPHSPDVAEPPAIAAGYITFGCLNNFAKVSLAALSVWGEILRQVPKSLLVLHCRPGAHRRRVEDFMKSRGVDADRLRFVDFLPTAQYLEQYQQIDIALDPFPYPGGTTTCDAVWMGVPVVTLAGQTALSRGGLSILSNVGRPELAARTKDQYVQIATGLASDLKALTEIRHRLRPMMQASPLLDAPQFARDIEQAYRWMWSQRSL